MPLRTTIFRVAGRCRAAVSLAAAIAFGDDVTCMVVIRWTEWRQAAVKDHLVVDRSTGRVLPTLRLRRGTRRQ
jgi:hypothetical protein